MKGKPEDVDRCSGRTGGSLQMNRLSFRNNHRLKLETSGGLPMILEESMEEYTSQVKAKLEDVNQCLGRTGWI
jgi:hypothetical protein